ncbi:hypothetical protein Cpir12675_004583 [Ceratocystis pirilliformis]|uniref:Uncharacterized protein n=1 Tax=Ceratocystis pirilliformis TaxID=259994 RepID=A0ABR3YWM1_9PEZI
MAESSSGMLRCEERDPHCNSLQSFEYVFDPVGTRHLPGHHIIQIIATPGTLQCTCGENISDIPTYFLNLQINAAVGRLDNQLTSRTPCVLIRPCDTTSDCPLEHLNPMFDDRWPSLTMIPEAIGTQSNSEGSARTDPADFLDPD